MWFKSGEIIAAMLLTHWHNLTFYQDLMRVHAACHLRAAR